MGPSSGMRLLSPSRLDGMGWGAGLGWARADELQGYTTGQSTAGASQHGGVGGRD